MAETPKPKKEPKKKKPKWPLFAAGALAAGTGWYALNKENSEQSHTSEEENPPSAIQPDQGVRHVIIGEILRTTADITVESARQGNIEAAMEIFRKIKRMQREEPFLHQNEKISRELGIGIHEIAAFENGFYLREDLNALDEGPDENGYVADPDNFYPEIAIILQHQAKDGDPFDPIFLGFINKTEQGLKDLVSEITIWLQSRREIGYQERADVLRHAYRIQ